MSKDSGHGQSRMQLSLIIPNFSVKNILISVLLVFIILPQTSYEFFEFKGDAVGRTVDTEKRIAKRPFEKKFKFHKIERIQIEDGDEGKDDEEDEDQDDKSSKNNDNDKSKSKRNKERGKDNDEDDEGGTDASIPTITSADVTESDELPYKRARKSFKDRPAENSQTNGNEKKRSTKGKKQRDKNIADDNSQSAEGKTFFGFSFFSNPSRSESDNRGYATTSSNEDASLDKQEKRNQSNSIIDWLKYFSSSGDKSSAEPQEIIQTDSAESWLTYLDRWPINSFFPIGRPPKPIRIPRSGSRSSLSENENGNSDEAEPEAMSEANFESLLHTLPSFVPKRAHVVNTECRQQLQIFHRQLRGNKLWTLQMLDSTGKITTGLLRGNINQFGDFEQCTHVKVVVKVTPEIPVRVRGKYCLAHIEIQTSTKELKVPLHYVQGRGLWRSHFGNPSHFVPRYGIANWGVCIPHLCNGEIVQQMIEANLRAYNKTGVEFHVEVNDDDCYTRTNFRIMKLIKKDRNFTLTVCGICGLMTLCLSSIFITYKSIMKSLIFALFEMVKIKLKRKNEESEEVATESTDNQNELIMDAEDTAVAVESTADEDILETTDSVLHSLTSILKEISDAFSPQRTFIQLLDSSDNSTTRFPIFNILKLITTFALYVSLKYIMIGHLPITNRDKLVRTLDQTQSIIFRSPMIYMDVLLMISGFLIAYQLAEEMEQKQHIQLLKRLTLKITRFLPTMFAVLFFQTWILPFCGAGPLWTNLIGQNTRLCEQQMWRNFFSVQNAIGFEETCSPMTIQLALEVQLYILGPLIVWLYYTDADAALYIYGALNAMSVAARYSRTQREYLSVTLFHGMNVSKFYRTANLIFSSPITRATPYLLGIGTGLLHRSHLGTLEIASQLMPVGWFFALLGLFWCFWSPSMGMHTDFVYSAGDAASYAAWCPLILGLSLAWCIFMFPKHENSILHFLTTMRPVLFLSRITFPMQLMTYVVVLYNAATVSEPRKYNLSDLVNLNEIGVILSSGILLAVLIDVPAQQVRKIIINRLFIERAAHEHDHEHDVEPSSGAEASEAETENEGATDTNHERQLKNDANDISQSADVEEVEVEVTAVEEVEEGDENAVGDGEDIVDEDNEISEEDEVIKHPEKGHIEEETISFTRRRRRFSDD